ncbi:MAG: NfeD family protein [Clostridiales bacterium]|nr:NfeD family protein [Clostridiales bacterium]
MPFNLDAESIQKIVWLALLLLFAVSEAVTVGLTSIWFAAGALVALIAALLGGPLWIQITLFLAVSLLCLAAVRPLAKRHLNDRVEPTNADRVIGEEAQVTEDIDNIHGKGAVIIRGMTWSARSENDSIIAAGARVRVLRIEGVKVFVEPIAASVAAGEPKSW